MRRRGSPESPLAGAAGLPVQLLRFDPADWPVTIPRDVVEMVEESARVNPHSGSVHAGIEAMRRHYQRRAWNSAAREWCREHIIVTARGEIDWRRFNALRRAATVVA